MEIWYEHAIFTFETNKISNMKVGYKLKLCSKKLRSGKCQIKFFVTPPSPEKEESFYGYMLAESGSTLREVVRQIEDEVKMIGQKECIYNHHLFNLGRKNQPRSPIYFFRQS